MYGSRAESARKKNVAEERLLLYESRWSMYVRCEMSVSVDCKSKSTMR